MVTPGFRGGYSPIADSNLNNSITYVGNASNTAISGRRGIAGTPDLWDGQSNNSVEEGMPGGSAGRGLQETPLVAAMITYRWWWWWQWRFWRIRR
jgi:hypothetical protein